RPTGCKRRSWRRSRCRSRAVFSTLPSASTRSPRTTRCSPTTTIYMQLVHTSRANASSPRSTVRARSRRARRSSRTRASPPPPRSTVEPAATTLLGAERIVRARALFEAQRNKESEQEFRQVLDEKDLDPTLRCNAAFHLAQSVFKQRERPRAAALFDDAIKLC